MTAPAPTQTNAKAWTALIGTLIGAIVPYAGQIAGVLPAPYGAILTGILGLLGLLTGAAVHQKSNAPKGTVLVPVPIPTTQPGTGWPEK